VTIDIRVLGPGCVRCEALYERTLEAVSGLGLDATVTKVEDVGEMLALGILASPALVIDGRLAMAGHVPTVGRLQELLAEALAAER
jgi:small redox-active disulfide protein 2